MVEVDRQIRTKMVALRKSNNTIDSISEDTGICTPYVRIILQEELKDEYDKYNLSKPKKSFTPEEIRKVVDLRKKYRRIRRISELTNISRNHITQILKKELGVEYPDYFLSNMYKRYLQGLCDEQVAEICGLRKEGKSIEEIKHELGFSLTFIWRVLTEEGEEKLAPPFVQPRDQITDEVVQSEFEKNYAQIIKKINVSSSNHLEVFKQEALTTLLEIVKYPSDLKIIPVFIYAYLRSKGVNISISQLRDVTWITRHQIFKILKKLNGRFPEYLNRDRKQVVLNKVLEATIHFQLSSTFYKNTRRILDKIWDILSATTDGVIACTIATLSLISINCVSPNITQMCGEIGASHSAVMVQIRDRILPSLNVSGFTTLAESKRLITREVLEKVVGIQNLPDYPEGSKNNW